MTILLGLGEQSPWLRVVRRPPVQTLLGYLHSAWQEYVAAYSTTSPPLHRRTEPQLTEGFGAFLTQKANNGHQPFDGVFYAELTRFDLAPNGTAIRIGRTDIEWTLSGFASFVVEFKLIGGGRPAIYYVTEGIQRFVSGRYGPKALEGAMWAIVRPGSPENISHVQAHIGANLVALRCVLEGGQYLLVPSTLASAVAAFDSLHTRDASVNPTPIRLAHVFTELA